MTSPGSRLRASRPRLARRARSRWGGRLRCGATADPGAGLRRAARGGVLLPAAARTAEQVGGDHVSVTQPHQARRRAARPRADPAGRRPRSARPRVVVYEKGLQPAVDQAVDQRGAGPRPRRRRRREPRPDVHPDRVRRAARRRGRQHRPALLARPGALRRRRPGRRRPARAPSTRPTGPTTPPTPKAFRATAGRTRRRAPQRAWPTAPAPRSSPATTPSATSPSATA